MSETPNQQPQGSGTTSEERVAPAKTDNKNTTNGNKQHQNNNRKSKNKSKNGGNNNANKFVGAEPTLAVLGIKNNDVKTDNFLVFQRSIENYVLSKFDHSGDIAYLVQELQNPMPRIMKLMPTLKTLKEDYGIDPKKKDDELSADEKA